MKTYYINNQIVTKKKWSEAFTRHQNASVILRTVHKPPVYQPPECPNPITVERLENFKRKKENT